MPLQNWAINASKNYYLYNMPLYFKTDGSTNYYYFYFQDNLYEIYITGTFSGELIEFKDKPPEGNLFEEFKGAIRDAFVVFGRFGSKPENPIEIINAVFTNIEGDKNVNNYKCTIRVR